MGSKENNVTSQHAKLIILDKDNPIIQETEQKKEQMFQAKEDTRPQDCHNHSILVTRWRKVRELQNQEHLIWEQLYTMQPWEEQETQEDVVEWL